MKIDNFFKNNLIMFFASGLGSFFNLLYQLVMLRLVSGGVFASLNSLLSLLTIISVPAMAFSNLVTKRVSASNATGEAEQLKAIWRKLAAHAVLFSLSVFALIILFSRNIAGFLQIPSINSIIILGGIVFLSAVSPVVNGGLSGLEKFGWLAVITVLSAFLKLGLSFGLVINSPNQLEAALIGFLASILVGIIISIFPLSFLLRGKASFAGNLRRLYFYILPVLIVSVCFAVLTNIDMLIVKHFFSGGSQDYAVAQMIGKIVFFASGMIPVVMFPRAAGLHAVRENSKHILRRSLSFSFILSFLSVALFNFFPQFIMRILTGSHNIETIILARLFSLTMLFYALSGVLFYYQLSVEDYRFIKYLMALTILQSLLMNLFIRTTFLIAAINCAISLSVFILNLAFAFRPKLALAAGVKQPSNLIRRH